MKYPKRWIFKESKSVKLWEITMRLHYKRWRTVLRAMWLTMPFQEGVCLTFLQTCLVLMTQNAESVVRIQQMGIMAALLWVGAFACDVCRNCGRNQANKQSKNPPAIARKD